MVFGCRYGRKWLALSSGPLSLVSWCLILLSRSIYVLYLVRFLQGVLLAIVFGVVPLYIAEISEPKVRGFLAGNFQTMWAFGILFTYVTGPYMDFRMYIFVCAIQSIIFTIGFPLMPESPYFLLMKNRDPEAKDSLMWLRGNNYTEDEFGSMKASVEKDLRNEVSWKDLFATGKDRKIFFTVQFLCFIKYMIGLPAMNTNAADMFFRASGGLLGEHEATIIFGLIFFCSAFFGSFLSDLIGRRPLLIGTCGLIGLSYSLTGAYFYLVEKTTYNISSLSWIMYSTIATSTALSNIGPSSLLQTIQGEMFPSHTRAMGSGLMGITAALATFMDLKQYQTVIDLFGIYMNFFIFASFAFLGSITLFCILKETAGKTLGEIQTDLEEEPKMQE